LGNINSSALIVGTSAYWTGEVWRLTFFAQGPRSVGQGDAAFAHPWDIQSLLRFDEKETQWLIVKNAPIPSVPAMLPPESIAAPSAKRWRKLQTLPASVHMQVARATPFRRQRPDSLAAQK
jgi:hypothetical protein